MGRRPDLVDVHDCTAAGCEGAVRRAHAEAVAQGMPAFIEPNGDALHDAAVTAGYRALARVLASATPASTLPADPSNGVAPTGAGIGAAETSPHAVEVPRGLGTSTAARAPDGASSRRSNGRRKAVRS